MKFSLKPLVFILFILLFIFQLAKSLSVTCEAGGPYGTGSTVIAVGNVSGEVSNSSTVIVNISKSGTLKATKSTTSDSDGSYYAIFDQTFDVGSYELNVSASNSTHSTTCDDTFDVILQQVSTACEQKTVSVQGRTMYTSGGLVNSGNVFISIENVTTTNITSFSGGNFSISLTTCLYKNTKYILYLSILDSTGRKGTTQILFTPT